MYLNILRKYLLFIKRRQPFADPAIFYLQGCDFDNCLTEWVNLKN